MKTLQKISYSLFPQKIMEDRYYKEFLDCIDKFVAKSSADILTISLNVMKLALGVSGNYRKNIKGFNATYVFTDKNEDFHVAAIFNNNKLKVIKGPNQIVNPEFTLIFKDSKSLVALLFSKSPDVIDALLNQKVNFKGDINYFYKFAYMVKRLQLGKFLTN